MLFTKNPSVLLKLIIELFREFSFFSKDKATIVFTVFSLFFSNKKGINGAASVFCWWAELGPCRSVGAGLPQKPIEGWWIERNGV